MAISSGPVCVSRGGKDVCTSVSEREGGGDEEVSGGEQEPAVEVEEGRGGGGHERCGGLEEEAERDEVEERRRVEVEKEV